MYLLYTNVLKKSKIFDKSNQTLQGRKYDHRMGKNFLDPYIQAVGELKIKLRGIRKQYRKAKQAFSD